MTPFHAIQRTDKQGNARWVWYSDVVELLETAEYHEVIPTLRRLEAAARQGLHAVGWIAYEAAPGFDPHLQTYPLPHGSPLLRFTLYRTEHLGLPPRTVSEAATTHLEPEVSEADFMNAIHSIHQAIANGETYQVNFTYPFSGTLDGETWALFRKLRQAQAAKHQAYIEEADQTVICASPERFFRHEGSEIMCKPMKGTAKPGAEFELEASIKNRSENIMIVDMIRNDLGKIAMKGSVKADPLFEIESYPSVVQMTSTVTARGSTSPVDWLCALFPCASITGAPKRKTMEWIRHLENAPRGIYTGAIGGFYADGVSEFNVAIRTAILNKQTNTLRYHSGCGIVWDSDPQDEYKESLLKTAVLKHRATPYHLIETMRAEPVIGIPLWPYHRQRLVNSAASLGFELDTKALEAEIQMLEVHEVQKVRITLSIEGQLNICCSPCPVNKSLMSFRLDTQITSSQNESLKHKTTRRDLYNEARKRCADVDETLLINEHGECMEFTIGNLVWEKDGQAYTPLRDSGLLPGVARAAALAKGSLQEKICRPKDLEQADQLYLLNALRGKVKMEWIR
ncbi:chorismate-binding protein [Kiritimatiellota bacterium B12222]|nr:chorismate-binding protein [Kiritimatiellota bacterium B12222]